MESLRCCRVDRQAGAIHLRFFAAVPNSAGDTALPIMIALESWRWNKTEGGGGAYIHGFPRCAAAAPIGSRALAMIPIWGGGISPILWMVAKFTVAGFDAPVGTKTCFIRMPPGLVCVSALDCLNWDCYIVMILYCSQGTFRGKGRAYVDRPSKPCRLG